MTVEECFNIFKGKEVIITPGSEKLLGKVTGWEASISNENGGMLLVSLPGRSLVDSGYLKDWHLLPGATHGFFRRVDQILKDNPLPIPFSRIGSIE